MSKYYMQIYRHTLSPKDEENWVHISNLDLHPDMALLLAEMGVIDMHREYIPVQHAHRLQKLIRLRNLGVNLSGAAIIFELLERIEILQNEIERLKRR